MIKDKYESFEDQNDDPIKSFGDLGKKHNGPIKKDNEKKDNTKFIEILPVIVIYIVILIVCLVMAIHLQNLKALRASICGLAMISIFAFLGFILLRHEN